jgi:hypothetical protein
MGVDHSLPEGRVAISDALSELALALSGRTRSTLVAGEPGRIEDPSVIISLRGAK